MKQDRVAWDGILHPETLSFAIDHVDHCLWTAGQLDHISQKVNVTALADSLLGRIREDYQGSEFVDAGWIGLTKTQLTHRYAGHSSRPHSWKPDALYRQLIPNLIERGLAKRTVPVKARAQFGFAVQPLSSLPDSA